MAVRRAVLEAFNKDGLVVLTEDDVKALVRAAEVTDDLDDDEASAIISAKAQLAQVRRFRTS